MSASVMITVEPVESFRDPAWQESIPSRPGWRVNCDTCGRLEDGYAYAREQDAKAVATKHRRRHPEVSR